jgi:hypothetical protein
MYVIVEQGLITLTYLVKIGEHFCLRKKFETYYTPYTRGKLHAIGMQDLMTVAIIKSKVYAIIKLTGNLTHFNTPVKSKTGT